MTLATSLLDSARSDIATRGHTAIRGLATGAELEAARTPIVEAVERLQRSLPDLQQRNTYGKAFVQAMNLWKLDPAIEDFVFNQRFAHVAAQLLDVPSVRLYHDQALFKEGGGGRTPWHQDQVYWPLDTGLPGGGTITMWMALDDIPDAVGSMTFADGSHLHGDLGGGVIDDTSESALGQLVADGRFSTSTHGAMSAGDATFHLGWTLHSAGPNPLPTTRAIMTVIYFAADAHIADVNTPERRADHRAWLGGRPVGGPADGPDNPVLWLANG